MTELSDAEWVEVWFAAQQRRLSLFEQCVAAKSIRPWANHLLLRGRAIYAMAREKLLQADEKAAFANSAVEVGRALGRPDLTTWAGAVAKAASEVVEIEEQHLEAAKELAMEDVARAAALLAKDNPPDEEAEEPVHTRSHPAPGVPSWYYPEEGKP